MSTKTIKMEKDGKQADVHPNEQENMAAGGWTPVAVTPHKKPAPKAAAKPATDSDK